MVAHLLKLKLRLLTNGFKRSPGQLVAVIIGGVYALGMVTLLSLAAWHSADVADQFGWVFIGLSSLVVLGWAIIPPLLTGVDLTLEPQRFVHFGIDKKALGNGLILAGFISVPAILTIFGLLGFSTMWRMDAATLVIGIGSSLGTAVLAILLCQYLTITATALRGKRRFREFTFGLFFLLLVGIGPIFTSIANAAESIRDWVTPVATVLSYTPLGAFGAIPAAYSTGNLGMMVVYLLLAIVYLGALYFLLLRATASATVTPPAQQRAATAKGLGFFKLLPGNPTGAVAARALTYWFKDPRYAVSVIMVPMIPVIFYFAGGQSDDFTMMYLVGPILGILMGFSISADISYDNTAFALHVLTGVPGRVDRLGRALSCFIVSIIPILLAAILPAVLTDQSWRIPGDLGLSLAALLISLGVSSTVSARYTYAVPLPGDNPMKTPPGNGLRVALTQLGTFGIMGVLLIPALIPYLFGWFNNSMTLGFVTLAVGVVFGAVLLVLGIRIGGKWMDQRLPELMQSVFINR